MHPKSNILLGLFLLLAVAQWRFGEAGLVQLNGYSCPNASITIVEDPSTKPAGLFITTEENNFAIFSPNKKWQALSFNGDSVSIISTHNKASTTKLKFFNEKGKLELSKIKSKFYQNLVGLSFTSCNTMPTIYPDRYHAKRYYPAAYPQQQVAHEVPSIVYNNLEHSKLKKSIGEVYHLCLNQPIVDVYSSSVSARHTAANTIVLYRDFRYFAFRKPNLPLNINSLFLYNNLVFFVYNDKSIKIKTSEQLNDPELDLVVEARSLVKEFGKLDEHAVEVKLGHKLLLEELEHDGKHDHKDGHGKEHEHGDKHAHEHDKKHKHHDKHDHKGSHKHGKEHEKHKHHDKQGHDAKHDHEHEHKHGDKHEHKHDDKHEHHDKDDDKGGHKHGHGKEHEKHKHHDKQEHDAKDGHEHKHGDKHEHDHEHHDKHEDKHDAKEKGHEHNRKQGEKGGHN